MSSHSPSTEPNTTASDAPLDEHWDELCYLVAFPAAVDPDSTDNIVNLFINGSTVPCSFVDLAAETDRFMDRTTYETHLASETYRLDDRARFPMPSSEPASSRPNWVLREFTRDGPFQEIGNYVFKFVPNETRLRGADEDITRLAEEILDDGGAL